MSIHMFHGEIRNILCGYPLLSGAMYVTAEKETKVLMIQET